MKKLLKFFSVLIIALLVICTTVFAATEVEKTDATMTLVEDNVATISFGKYGEFEKAMVECNTTEKYVEISLTVKNNAEAFEDKNANVVLLIDASRSMSTNEVVINGTTTTRKQAVLNSAQELITKLLAANSNIKIGIVEFATSTEVDSNGYTIEGTEADAKTITSSLTNDADTLEAALNTVASDTMGARTNIEAGLIAANNLLETDTTADTEDYIVLLTDAIPNTAIGVTMDTYTDATATPTREKLLELDAAGINIISVLIDMTDDEIAVSTEDPKPTYREVAEKIFGTSASPTTGEVYYISDDELEDTITNEIYASITQESYVLENIVIKDYIPQNIVDNFTYLEVTSATIGTATTEIDTTDNSITWTIPELNPGETATLVYRLYLNDTFSSEILDVNLPTNENVVITYEEEGTPGSEESDDCPIIKLTVEEEETPTNNTTDDNTVADKDIPQTGSTGAFILGISIIAIAGTIFYTRSKRI